MLSSVPSILIRDVPEDVRAELARRAARSGQSMQEYLKAALVEMVTKPDIEEWLDRVRGRLAEPGFRGLTSDEIVEDIREMRGSL
jgi:plasmid stability protein